jgi:hypothetical protein
MTTAYKVGAPYIINGSDCPDMLRIVVCISSTGKCRYLSIRDNRRWPSVMQLSERSTPLEDFGMQITIEGAAFKLTQIGESKAQYSDGKTRRWQGAAMNMLPFFAPEPKYWRLDDQVAKHLAEYIQPQTTTNDQ